MKWDEELVEYIDFTFGQLDQLRLSTDEEIQIPADLYFACLSVVKPDEKSTIGTEFVEMKKADVINMVTEAHLIIHA